MGPKILSVNLLPQPLYPPKIIYVTDISPLSSFAKIFPSSLSGLANNLINERRRIKIYLRYLLDYKVELPQLYACIENRIKLEKLASNAQQAFLNIIITTVSEAEEVSDRFISSILACQRKISPTVKKEEARLLIRNALYELKILQRTRKYMPKPLFNAWQTIIKATYLGNEIMSTYQQAILNKNEQMLLLVGELIDNALRDIDKCLNIIETLYLKRVISFNKFETLKKELDKRKTYLTDMKQRI